MCISAKDAANWFDVCFDGNIDEVKLLIDKDVTKYETRSFQAKFKNNH